jgi:hypothetical protein
VIDSEILAQIAIFLAKPISKLLLVSQKNLQDDQKTLYIKEINPKLRLSNQERAGTGTGRGTGRGFSFRRKLENSG